MENNDIEFKDIMTKLKGGKTQLIIEMTGIWIAGGKYGLTWKIVSGKFQLSSSNKITFIEDSDTEKAVKEEEDEDDEEESLTPRLESVKLETTIANSDDEENSDPESAQQDQEQTKEEPVKTTRGRKTTKK
jgi:hypothetical protein